MADRYLGYERLQFDQRHEGLDGGLGVVLGFVVAVLYGGSIAPGHWHNHQVTIQDVFEAVGAEVTSVEKIRVLMEQGAEAGVFDLADVQAAIGRKIVRRHPHVFGDAVARTAADGSFRIDNVPAGRHRVRIWHEAMDERSYVDSIFHPQIFTEQQIARLRHVRETRDEAACQEALRRLTS